MAIIVVARAKQAEIRRYEQRAIVRAPAPKRVDDGASRAQTKRTLTSCPVMSLMDDAPSRTGGAQESRILAYPLRCSGWI